MPSGKPRCEALDLWIFPICHWLCCSFPPTRCVPGVAVHFCILTSRKCSKKKTNYQQSFTHTAGQLFLLCLYCWCEGKASPDVVCVFTVYIWYKHWVVCVLSCWPDMFYYTPQESCCLFLLESHVTTVCCTMTSLESPFPLKHSQSSIRNSPQACHEFDYIPANCLRFGLLSMNFCVILCCSAYNLWLRCARIAGKKCPLRFGVSICQ